MTVVIGIDPGKSGALVALDVKPFTGGSRIGGPKIFPTPVIEPATKKSRKTGKTKKLGRKEYDIGAIRLWLARIRDDSAAQSFTGEPDVFVAIEKSQTLPPEVGGGGITNFARGECRGYAWLCEGLLLRYELVPPRTWQSKMLAGTPGDDTKQRAVIAAKRLFPGVSLKRTDKSRKDDDGIADALLIAEYGRRILRAET